jgi:hypothetical protein
MPERSERVEVSSHSIRVESSPAFDVYQREHGTLSWLTDPTRPRPNLLPADGSYIFKPKDAPPVSPAPLPTKPAELPATLVETVPVPGKPNQRDVRPWKLVLRADRAPLPWDATCKAYCTTLRVGLTTEPADGPSTLLGTPVVVQLTAERASVDPPRLELSKSGVEGYASAIVALPTHEETNAFVTASSDFGESKFSIDAEPQMAVIELQSSLTSLAGFGIGTATISIVRRAEDGIELKAPEASVSLSTTAGRLGDGVLSFSPQSVRVSTSLRSAWIGQANVTARTNNLTAGPIPISFTTPWSYLVAILLGAAAGAFVRVLSGTRDRKWADFAVGALTGVILAACSFVGVTSLVQIPATAVVTEVGCFVIAALEAYAGRSALDRVTGVRGNPSAPAQPQPGPAPTDL